jgi:hypothetical protein
MECERGAKKTPCHRNGERLRPMFLSISGSDVFVGDKELLQYDREPWTAA